MQGKSSPIRGVGSELKFGYRVHLIVRETEEEARQYADRLLSRLDEQTGKADREDSLDAKNHGDQRQAGLRPGQAEGIEAFILWGYPPMAECDLLARLVLPDTRHGLLVFG